MAVILCSTTFSTSFDVANFTISHQKGTTQTHVKLSNFFKQYFGNLILMWDIELLSRPAV